MPDSCKSIGPNCPIEDTAYGYYPSLPGNAVLAAVFGVCALAQVILGVRSRLKLYSSLVFIGCVGEVIGYVGRTMLHNNPWSESGMILNILLLIVSPSFMAAALYLTLKQVVLYYGPEYSVLKPKLYTWIFITCDAFGFVTQLVGGGVSSSATNGKGSQSTVNLGNDIMIAGIAFQAVTMAIAGILAIVFMVRRHMHLSGRFAKPSSRKEKARTTYLLCAVAAFVFILIRCIYR